MIVNSSSSPQTQHRGALSGYDLYVGGPAVEIAQRLDEARQTPGEWGEATRATLQQKAQNPPAESSPPACASGTKDTPYGGPRVCISTPATPDFLASFLVDQNNPQRGAEGTEQSVEREPRPVYDYPPEASRANLPDDTKNAYEKEVKEKALLLGNE